MNTVIQLAAPAPTVDDDELEPGDVTPELRDENAYLDFFCEQYDAWCRTRRFYCKPSLPASLLGKLTAKTRATANHGGPDAIASAEFVAFHLAVLGQPIDALDRQVFELHYRWRVSNVKTAAAQLKIGRQHWYTLLREFRRRAYAASKEILQTNLDAADNLPHRST